MRFNKYINEFKDTDKVDLKTAIAQQYPDSRPGRREQILRAIRLKRQVDGADALMSEIKIFLDSRGRDALVEYLGNDEFRVTVTGVRISND